MNPVYICWKSIKQLWCSCPKHNVVCINNDPSLHQLCCTCSKYAGSIVRYPKEHYFFRYLTASLSLWGIHPTPPTSMVRHLGQRFDEGITLTVWITTFFCYNMSAGKRALQLLRFCTALSLRNDSSSPATISPVPVLTYTYNIHWIILKIKYIHQEKDDSIYCVNHIRKICHIHFHFEIIRHKHSFIFKW